MRLMEVKLLKEKIMVLDGNSILNRAFYGLQGPKLLSTKDGLYTNAVFGFLNIMFKYLEEEKPDYMCVAFDLKAPTFRHKEYDGYKARRRGMPEELAVQVPIIKELLDAMNIKRIESEGYEADDIIGTVALMAENSGMECAIITGDRDSLQLVSGSTYARIVSTRRSGHNETEKYDHGAVVGRYGITPDKLIDVKGLMGDASDDIPGVPGIGEKTALNLIRQFGSMENLYENLGHVDNRNIADKLAEYREQAFLSRRLATIKRDVPVDLNICDMKIVPYDSEKLYELLSRLEFKSVIQKLNLSPSTMKREQYVLDDIRTVGSIESLREVIGEIRQAGTVSIHMLLTGRESSSQEVMGIAIALNEKQAVYISPCGSFAQDLVLSEMKSVLEDESIRKVGHDFKSMLVFLKTKGIEMKGIHVDTMIGYYLIEPARESYRLEEIAREILSFEIPMTEPGDINAANSACAAAAVILKLSRVIADRVSGNGQDELLYGVEIPLIYVLADMEFNGFKVDVEGLKKFSAELDNRIGHLVNNIYMLAGEEFNINSTKQLGTVLFDKLKLPAVKKTKTGYSTDVEVLEQLAPRHEIVSQILEYRQLMKLKTTYVDGLLSVVNPSTGKVHSKFNQTVTVTGRISSTEPNLQNIPIRLEMGRNIRKVFVASDANHVLIDADYSQIELRVLAHITGDSGLVEAFRKGDDIHTLTASQFFGVPPESVTPFMRGRAKTVNFSVIYGIGAYSLSRDLGVTRGEAERYIVSYLDRYPGVKDYMSSIIRQARDTGYVTTIFNRRRYIPELRSPNFNIKSFGERVAMNTPIQGSAADIIKIAMVKVYREMRRRNLKSKLILQVHDELIIDTYKDEVEEIKLLLKECMENAVELKVPLVTEVRTGGSWYETK